MTKEQGGRWAEVGERRGRCSLREAFDEVKAGGFVRVSEGNAVTITRCGIHCQAPTVFKALLSKLVARSFLEPV